tara:strand:- start:834 stop:1100 length:267 start_codon:yes stop_codon:yes gene_type:complete
VKINALDLPALWNAIKGNEDFQMCYDEAQNNCLDVPGYVNSSVVLVAIFAEFMFFLFLFISTRVMLKHRKKSAKNDGAERGQGHNREA